MGAPSCKDMLVSLNYQPNFWGILLPGPSQCFCVLIFVFHWTSFGKHHERFCPLQWNNGSFFHCTILWQHKISWHLWNFVSWSRWLVNFYFILLVSFVHIWYSICVTNWWIMLRYYPILLSEERDGDEASRCISLVWVLVLHWSAPSYNGCWERRTARRLGEGQLLMVCV